MYSYTNLCVGDPPPPKPTLCGGGGGGVGTFIEFPFMKMRWLGERGNRPVRLTFWVLLFVCSFSPESHGTPVRGTKRLGTENKRGYKKLIYNKKKKKEETNKKEAFLSYKPFSLLHSHIPIHFLYSFPSPFPRKGLNSIGYNSNFLRLTFHITIFSWGWFDRI